MISSSASKPSAETVTPSPGVKTRDSGGMTTPVTKAGCAALSEQAPKIAPERSNNRNFFIQKHELQFVTSAPGGGISGMYRQRIRYKYSELSPFPNSSVPERLFQRAGTFC